MSKTVTPQETARRRGLVDELGAIVTRRLEAKADEARENIIKDEMRDVWMDGKKATAAGAFQGDLFTATCSARSIEKTLDLGRLLKAVGIKKFLEAAKVTLAKYEELVAPADRVGYISLAQTGSRQVDVFGRDVATKKAAA